MADMEKILSQFVDGLTDVKISPFGNGHINHTFRAKVLGKEKPQNYLLQKMNSHVFGEPEAVMGNIQAVAEHLSKQSYPFKILWPIPTLSGQPFYRNLAGEHWRVFPFFENTFTHEKVETIEQAHEAAKAFGAFLKALDGIAVNQLKTTIPHFHDGLVRMRLFKEELGKASPEKQKEAEKEIREVLDNESIFKQIAHLNLPVRAVHHDTKINNLLFDRNTGHPVVVIDLDTVMPGIVLSDFGDLVRTSVSPAEEDEMDLSKVVFRQDLYEAILKGFLSEMKAVLTEEEKEHLPLAGPWLTLMQAARFLTDHLAGDVYYRTKYPGHNLVRARCQLHLFHEMIKAHRQLPR